MKRIEKKYNFIYKITNLINGKIYIGCHSTDNIEDGYMGSGKRIKIAINKYGVSNFSKVILEYHDSAIEMLEAEKRIVNIDFVKRDDNYNLSVGGHGGHKGEACYKSPARSKKISDAKKGLVAAIDAQGNRLLVSKDDIRLKTGELVGQTKGKATVKDKAGTILSVSRDDPRIKSGELVGVTKGLLVMKDRYGNRFQVTKDDPRIKSGELVGNTRGYTQTEESNIKRGNTQKGITKPQIYASCCVCRKTTTLPNIVRWHRDCK